MCRSHRKNRSRRITQALIRPTTLGLAWLGLDFVTGASIIRGFAFGRCVWPGLSLLVGFMDFSFLTGCASQFWHITSGVCRAVGACLGGGGRPATLPQDLVMACYQRVTRAQNRLLALMERVRAGRQLGGWSRAAPVLATCGLPRASKLATIVLPRRFGWLVHLVGYQAAGHGLQLAHLLGDPEMVALVRDVPQARRILAPLCRMLGVACEGLRVARRQRGAVALTDVADVGDLVPDANVPERFGYMPSAKWPRGVVRSGPARLKPA